MIKWPVLIMFAPVFVLLIGYALRRRERAKIDNTLRAHREYIRRFEERHPEYRGTRWGQP